MKMSLQEAIEILKVEKGVAELALSNGEGNVHEEEFVNAVDVIFNFIYDILQIGKIDKVKESTERIEFFLSMRPPTKTHQQKKVT